MSPLPFIQLLLLRAKIMNCCHVIIRKMSFDVSNLDHDPPCKKFLTIGLNEEIHFRNELLIVSWH